MESLLAAYSSSSDDEEQPHHHQQRNSSSFTSQSQTLTKPTSSNLSEPLKTSSLFSSLPKPKSSSISSLPPPKNQSKPKKVIQVKLPLNPSLPLDDDSDDEEKKPKTKPNQDTETTSSLKSFFSSLPAPRNSLGLGSGQSLGGGSGRKSTIDTSVAQSESVLKVEKNEIRAELNYGEGNLVNGASNLESGGDSSSNWYQNNEDYDNYQSYGNYEGNFVGNNVNSESGYGHYDGAATVTPMTMPVAPGPEIPDVFRNVGRGKRGRNEMPEIIEVKQDDLTKNRPREDQAKTTGIAFGPAYQTVSSKGKPSKLHKRKHQIGALYFDMKQNEMALSERRSKGFLTKAETQAKYGW
ncbi:hypothetical protein MKX01_021958 [Papaver californicum]|nr:hypothetical protein MKX01_034733 [Papaver californicum]KAI3980243.1 hypothetical protein MKX01_021958 [Papaver californicum]